MKYKNITGTFITFIVLFFLTSCSAKAPSQVVLQENINGDGSGRTTDREEMIQEPSEEQTAFYYVYVCGAVYEPGVYALPAGSRLYEAVEAAGGFLPDACEEYCNLASVVSDGMQYRIPTTEEVLSGNVITENRVEEASPGNTSAYDGNGLLDINLATAAELMTLPGIGQTRADAIITYRDEHGHFSNKEEIMQVTGIKEGLYSQIEGYITVR